MNLTFLPSLNIPDKQAVLYELAFDRSVVFTWQFLDHDKVSISNLSTGVIRDSIVPIDLTIPPLTRFIVISIYGSRAFPPCFTYIYAGLYVDIKLTTLYKLCSKMSSIFQYLSLSNFFIIPALFAIMAKFSKFRYPPPARFLCRQPSHPVLLCIFLLIGSFIFNEAWNIINSQSSIFHEWLPRAAKIIEIFLSFFLYAVYFYPLFLCYHASVRSRSANILGFYCVSVIFGLRISLDLPAYAITYARDVPFLILNIINLVPLFIVNLIVFSYFIARAITFHSCDICRLEFLHVKDIEEMYVKQLIKRKKINIKGRSRISLLSRFWDMYNTRSKILYHIWDYLFLWKRWVRRLFGINEFIRIPYIVKVSLSVLLYCLSQLIPVLLTQLIGVGGTVPTHICLWTPYLSQLQYKPNPMDFAERTFYLMKIAVYLTVLGAGFFCMIFALGILRRVTKDILNIRQGNYGLFKGKKNNDIDLDDAIRFFGVCVGFGFTGTLYFMVEVAIIGTFIVMAIQLERARDTVLSHVGYGAFFASFFIALIVQMIQKRITKIIFLENGTDFVIRNRSPLLHYWYFMMFTSVTRALTSYILRTLKLVLRYPLFSLRVDRNAETWSVRRGDGGFIGYCGMLKAEHEYNNPVVLLFLECIMHHIIYKHRSVGLCRMHRLQIDMEKLSVNTVDSKIKRDIHSIRARTRWFLALTLINNPMLRKAKKPNCK
ncbi:unnamed protein product [Cunninghamella echinulata]